MSKYPTNYLDSFSAVLLQLSRNLLTSFQTTVRIVRLSQGSNYFRKLALVVDMTFTKVKVNSLNSLVFSCNYSDFAFSSMGATSHVCQFKWKLIRIK